MFTERSRHGPCNTGTNNPVKETSANQINAKRNLYSHIVKSVNKETNKKNHPRCYE